MEAREERLVRFVLVLAALGLAGTLFFGLAWYRAQLGGTTLEDLSPVERQRLLEQALDASPGIYRPTWFEPRIGYTLHPRQTLEAWGSRFDSNELGYRAPAASKPTGTFRVLFVGDSWTFGMGVAREEAFPEVFARLAQEHSGLRKVQAWPLALPGYNTFNQLAALWFNYGRLQPDMVVFCPTDNDNHSTALILPKGFQWRGDLRPDQFGEPHALTYRGARLTSYRFHERWRSAYGALARAARRLSAQGIPVATYFAARFETERAHYWMSEAEMPGPYLVAPPRLTLGKWRNPPPARHGTAAAHALYGRMVYHLVAQTLGWPELPPAAPGQNLEGVDAVPAFSEPPAGDWAAAYQRIVEEWTERDLPAVFEAPVQPLHLAGPLDGNSGVAGRSTTVLLRRPEGVGQLRLTLRRLENADYLYPLNISVYLPSPQGGRRADLVLEAVGDPSQVFLVDLPPDLPPGSALDIVLEAEWATRSDKVRRGRSYVIERLDTVP